MELRPQCYELAGGSPHFWPRVYRAYVGPTVDLWKHSKESYWDALNVVEQGYSEPDYPQMQARVGCR